MQPGDAIDPMSHPSPTVSEMVEALCLFDEPMLNSRYHGLLVRRGLSGTGAELARLPSMALESARLAREGAIVWEKRAPPNAGEFIQWAERAILVAFLELSESQLRIAAQMARSAPDAATRAPFDAMCATHRHITSVLRAAVKSHPVDPKDAHPYRRNVQEEETEGDFRGQVERAARAAEDSGSGVRHIVLSPVGLRHLRDQGCFRDGSARIRGHPVSVDFGWDAPAFVIETFDRVNLEEIIARAEELDGPIPPRGS